MSYPLLDSEVVTKLTAACSNGGKATVLATSVARLYAVVRGQWKYTGIMGIIAYIMERDTKMQFIRIYDLKNFVVRFDVELSADPVYTMETEYFHTLEVDPNDMIGFAFALAREVNNPDEKNKTLTSEAKRFGSKVLQLCLKAQDIKDAQESFKAQGGHLEASSKRKGSTFMGKMKSAMKKVVGSQQQQTTIVSTPTNFQHVYHIGANPDGTMDVEKVPEEWKEMLKAAGIRKKDFKNPELNRMVVSTLSVMAPISQPKPATVKCSYTQTMQKDISVAEGETVYIVKVYGDGWTKIRKEDGSVGCAPSSYLEEIGGEAAAPPPPVPAPMQQQPKAASSPRNSPAPRRVPHPSASDSPAPVVPIPAEARAPPPRPSPAAHASPSKPVKPPPRPAPAGGRPQSAAPSRPQPAAAAPPQREASRDSTETPEHRNAESYDAPSGASEVASPKPDLPRGNPMLLAGIQGFNKEGLKAAETTDESERPSSRPSNPLLASIQGFDKGKGLKSAETSEEVVKPDKPNPLLAIKSGNFQLKKVERSEKTASKNLSPEVNDIASILRAKIGQIRAVQELEDDDDDEGSGWSDDE